MTTVPARPAPLDGVVVLEMARYSPVAFCTMMLADMGATVVRIEPPASSSLTGSALSPTRRTSRTRRFGWINRGKRSVALNLQRPRGQAVLRSLVARADVLVEGYRPGVMRRLGISYEAAAQANPRLIFCSVSGYGQDGPYAAYSGHDLNFVGLSGALALIGHYGAPPAIPLNLVADLGGAALHAVAGVLCALISRERTGTGQYIDISYLDSALSLLGATSLMRDYVWRGARPTRGKGIFAGEYPYYALYAAGDGKFLTLACTEAPIWEAFCKVVGRPDLMSAGPRPADRTRSAGAQQRHAKTELARLFTMRTRDEWFHVLAEAGICVGKVYDVPELASDKHLRHRGIVRSGGTAEGFDVSSAIRLSDTPAREVAAGPFRGQHTRQMLKELGYSTTQIAGLERNGVI